MSEVGDVLEEELRYHRARAFEYDEWWERRGRYDRRARLTGVSPTDAPA